MPNTKGPYATQAAAGTTQADAAEMTADTIMVTSGGEAAGVILRPMNRDEESVIVNGQSSASLLIYPRTGGKLNNLTANDPLTLPNNRAARFRAVDGGGNVIAFF